MRPQSFPDEKLRAEEELLTKGMAEKTEEFGQKRGYLRQGVALDSD